MQKVDTFKQKKFSFKLKSHNFITLKKPQKVLKVQSKKVQLYKKITIILEAKCQFYDKSQRLCEICDFMTIHFNVAKLNRIKYN